MQVIVTMGIVCLTLLFTSGCASKEPVKCEPIVKYVKPKMPVIDKAKVEQCRYEDQLKNIKCVLTNYMNVREERDKLRMSLEEISE